MHIPAAILSCTIIQKQRNKEEEKYKKQELEVSHFF